MDDPGVVYEKMMDILCDITQLGLIHCDYNEFNVMLGHDGKLTVIDFPQMVSTSHPNAAELFSRDAECVMCFFRKKLNYWMDEADRPDFTALLREACPEDAMDLELRASGFNNSDAKALEEALNAVAAETGSSSHETGYSASDVSSRSNSDTEDTQVSVEENAVVSGGACSEACRSGCMDGWQQDRHIGQSEKCISSQVSSQEEKQEGGISCEVQASGQDEQDEDVSSAAKPQSSQEVSAVVCDFANAGLAPFISPSQGLGVVLVHKTKMLL